MFYCTASTAFAIDSQNGFSYCSRSFAANASRFPSLSSLSNSIARLIPFIISMIAEFGTASHGAASTASVSSSPIKLVSSASGRAPAYMIRSILSTGSFGALYFSASSYIAAAIGSYSSTDGATLVGAPISPPPSINVT